MSTFIAHCDPEVFSVVHPLDDRPEEKCSDENLGPMKMSQSVRISLFVLRAYLVAMIGLVLYRVLEVAAFAHH
jgi:hypothetical protein